MKCAVHSDVDATGFCRNCGKPMCALCVRPVRDVLYCEDCLATIVGIPAAATAAMPAGTSSPGLARRSRNDSRTAATRHGVRVRCSLSSWVSCPASALSTTSSTARASFISPSSCFSSSSALMARSTAAQPRRCGCASPASGSTCPSTRTAPPRLGSLGKRCKTRSSHSARAALSVRS